MENALPSPQVAESGIAPSPAVTVPLATPTPEVQPSTTWQLSRLAGRLCELTSQGYTPQLSLSLGLLRQAQQDGQPCAWIQAARGTFHAPDAQAMGLDLSALPVIRAPNTVAAARAADHLLRSGAFGVVVLDLGTQADLPTAMQARLAGLARHHQSVLLCLTGISTSRRMRPGGYATGSTLGSMVSFRAEGQLHRRERGLFQCQLEVTKDKQHGPGTNFEELRRGPAGLC